MKLKQLIKDLPVINDINGELNERTILGLADNSIEVMEGFLFVAIPGFNSDGHEFIHDAINRGASIIVGEVALPSPSFPYIQVENSRKALGILSRNFYNNPSSGKTVIGITGTNGKTTTSYILKHLFESIGKTCTLIGTIENIVNGKVTKSINTTPSSLVLHNYLSESQDDIVIMEVSSHGLSQARITGIEFDYCVFTNLDHEHLDYHKTMEDYYQAKMLLFDHLKNTGSAIINTDNPWGDKAAKTLRKQGKQVFTIGQLESNDICIKQINLEHSLINIAIQNQLFNLYSPLAGIHNMYNMIIAAKTAVLFGVDMNTIIHSISNFKGVKGRFEQYNFHNGAKIIVDYAHTPEAFFHCLNTLRKNGAKRIIHIFGFRGNRDKTKRSEMILVTSQLSDLYILTLDDLNDVPKQEMIEDLQELNEEYGNDKGVIMNDRTLAIKWAVDNSLPGDYIIITGKGHENYQQSFQIGAMSDKDTVLHVMNQTLQVKERKI